MQCKGIFTYLSGRLSGRMLLGIFAVAGVGIFATLTPASASVSGTVADIVAWFATIIIELLGKLLIALIEILIAVTQYNDFINAPAVTRGWILVRDFSNMAFLIIFIAIAFATILGIEKYEWKRLLPKLLIMAVAINFSKTIAGIVIDAAQVIMMTFVNGFKDVAAANLIRGFGLAEMMALDGEDVATAGAIAGASLLAVVLLTIAVVTVGIIVIMFLVRVIYLWILIVLAPLAFMLSATPGAEGKFNEWWQKFIRYTFVGPILAFFLWLSFSIMAAVPPGGNIATQSGIQFHNEQAQNTSAGISVISRSDHLLSYAISIALLLLSLSIANNIGVAGGSLAGDALNKIKSTGKSLAKLGALGLATGGLIAPAAIVGKKIADKTGVSKAAKFGASKIGGIAKRKILHDWSTQEGAGRMRRGLKYLTKEGWQGFFARGEQQRRWAAEKAVGAAREGADQLFTRSGFLLHKKGVKQVPWREIAEHKIEQEQVKEFSQFSKDRFMTFAEEAQKVKGVEGDRLRRSVILAGANKGYLDDKMAQTFFRNKYGKLGLKKYAYKDGKFYDDRLLGDFLYDYLGNAEKVGQGREVASQDTMRVLDDLEDIGRSTNHWEYTGHSQFDSERGKYVATEHTLLANKKNQAVDSKNKEFTIGGKKVKADSLVWNADSDQWTADMIDETGKVIGNTRLSVQTDARGKFKSWQALDQAGNSLLTKEEEAHFNQKLSGAFINKPMQNFAIGEMNKLGARDKNRVAPHNFIGLKAVEVPVIDPETGEQMIDEETGELKTEVKILRGGELTSYNRGMVEALRGESTRELQHTQARLKEWFFASNTVKATGGITPDHVEKLEEIRDLYELNPDLVRGLYGLLAGDQDNRDGFVVEIEDSEGNVTGERMFGDERKVRERQKVSLELGVSELIGDLKDKTLPEEIRGEMREEAHALMHQYAKINSDGVEGSKAYEESLRNIATKAAITADGQFKNFYSDPDKKKGEEGKLRSDADKERYEAYKASDAVNSWLAEVHKQTGTDESGNARHLTRKYAGIGTSAETDAERPAAPRPRGGGKEEGKGAAGSGKSPLSGGSDEEFHRAREEEDRRRRSSGRGGPAFG